MKKYHIYGIGNALVDTELQVTDADLTRGSVDKSLMTLVDETRQQELMELFADNLVACKRSGGGSGANTIFAAANFGARCFYSCKVANDDNGWFYINEMKHAGVDVPAHSAEQPGITGKCLVMITPDAERTMNTFLGISETLGHPELDIDALKQSEYVYVEGYLVSSPDARAASIELMSEARKHGVKTALTLSDPAMVQFFHDGLLEMIGEGVDLIFCNIEEAKSFTRSDTLDGAVTAMKAYAKEFVITRGSEGAVVWDGKQLIPVAASPVEAINENGAGDMFAGAYLYGITHGLNAENAAILASVSAGEVVSQFGPRLGREQQQDILKQSVFDVESE